jgi:hypothetical protein
MNYWDVFSLILVGVGLLSLFINFALSEINDTLKQIGNELHKLTEESEERKR